MGGLIPRPADDEVPAYYGRYIARVPDGDIVETLATQLDGTDTLLRGLSDEQALHRYADGKWSIKEVLGHLADAERVFAYRVLRFARADDTPLPGFEENDYVPAGHFDPRTISDLLAELRTVRAATVSLLRGLPDGALENRGRTSGVEMRAGVIPWIIAGHELHHRAILRERYLERL